MASVLGDRSIREANQILEIKLSLAVALIVSMGLGALLSGLYLTWIKVRNYFQFWGKSRQLKNREKQIKHPQEDIESHQA